MAGKGELSASQVRALTKPGKHRVAPNLFLYIANGRRSYMFRGKLNGQEVWRGLGSPEIVPLREARAAALAMRLEIHKGDVPSRRRRPRAVPTFAEVAEEYIVTHEKRWRDHRAARTWRNTLAQHASKLARLPVDAIDGSAVASAIKAVWISSPSTARKVRGRIEMILDYAKAKGHRRGENPAVLKGNLEHLLPPLERAVKHFDAVPVTEIPLFAAELMARNSVSARALFWTLLNACRTGDTIEARFDEINMSAKLWELPEGRTKAGRAFRIPLSDAALAVIADLPRRSEYLFSASRGRPLSNMAMLNLMKDIRGPKATVHGLRSSFTDWCSETGQNTEVVERALDHQIDDKVRAAYARSDLLDARRELMNKWAQYVTSARPRET